MRPVPSGAIPLWASSTTMRSRRHANGFCVSSKAFAREQAIPPVELVDAPAGSPFRYKIVAGTHRLLAGREFFPRSGGGSLWHHGAIHLKANAVRLSLTRRRSECSAPSTRIPENLLCWRDSNSHSDDGADAGKTVGHEGDQGASVELSMMSSRFRASVGRRQRARERQRLGVGKARRRQGDRKMDRRSARWSKLRSGSGRGRNCE
jgi:hypothetical protein